MLSFDFEISERSESKPSKEKYDVVIIGAGPAGCTAAIYARRFLLDTLIISKDLGGLIADADIVDNYPGLPEVSGNEISKRFLDHAKKYGAEVFIGTVKEIEKIGKEFLVKYDNSSVLTKAVIIATGEKHRKLNVPGEKKFIGRGVSYCGICDAPLYKDKTVAIVGGGNTAFADAQLLAKYARKVYLIHRRNWFRADPVEVEKVKSNEKIELLTPFVVEAIKGENRVEKLILRETREEDGKILLTSKRKELMVDGIFVDIGLIPNTELAKKLGVVLNERKYIVVDDLMRTNIEGVFAAGDCTDKGSRFRQVVLAAAQGAIAANSAYEVIRKDRNI